MEITRKNEFLSTNGEPPVVGDKFPLAELTKKDGSTVSTKDLLDKVTLISVVPDINTRVCSISTKHFNKEADQFTGINFYTVSTNTPGDQENWCAAEGVKNMELLSDEQHDFGKKLGLFIEASGVDSRSIWIIDDQQKIIYRELIMEMTDEPNYDAALQFLRELKD